MELNKVWSFVLSLLLIPMIGWAQDYVYVTVEQPGTLQEVVEEQNAQTAISLRIKGELNIADIGTLREMAKLNVGTLRHLDLSEVELAVSEGMLVTEKGNECKVTDCKALPDHCFEFTQLQSVILPSSVERVGAYGFVFCRQLKEVTLGENVIFIGLNCFNVCALERIVIPDNVVEIGGNAFNNIGSLRSVVLGKKLKIIGSGAFANSKNITEISSRIFSPFTINNNSFAEEVYEGAKLMVPAGCGNYYKNCSGWKNFNHVVESDSEDALFMLRSCWNQKSPFNDDCPPNTVAGCGAIAIAQLMNYYKKPSAGFGQVSYVCNSGATVEANFSEHPFDWSNICDSYGESNSETERKAVANLVFMAGAAVKMEYGNSSSATWRKMLWGLQHYMHFSPRSRYHHRRFYSTAEWTELLNRELEARHPVLYNSSSTKVNSTSRSGHIYVIDGKDVEGNYHCNYGNTGRNRDQFTSLNLIIAGNGVALGNDSVNYHHFQSMATQLYPEDGLTENDFDSLPVALSSPLVLEDVDAQSKEITVINKVRTRFTYSTISHDSVVHGKLSLGFYLNDELVTHTNEIDLSKDNTTIHHSVNSSFTLPQDLEDGDYEMSIISRAIGSASWARGWSDAPNIIPVTVRGGVFTFHMPDYHCGETNLCLDGMPQLIDRENQRFIAFTLHNPSTNNFENELKVCFGDKTQTLLTSIYDGQSVTYQFVVDTSTEIEDICLSYYETNRKDWIPLLDNGASLDDKSIGSTSRHLSVYSINGQLLKQFSLPVTQQEYDRVLNQLPNGLYILSDQKGVRKYVKRTRNGRNM